MTESAGLTVQRLDGDKAGSVVPVSELWNRPGYKGVLLYLIRRAGCKLCRAEAVELAAIKDQLAAQGYLLVGVVGEELGHETFLNEYFNGEMYLDEGRKLSKIMAAGTMDKLGWVNYYLGMGVATAAAKADSMGIPGNMKGNGTNLGGVWVIKGGNAPKVLIEYQEKFWGDAVAISDVLSAVGAPASAKKESKRVSAKRVSSKRVSDKRVSSSKRVSKTTESAEVVVEKKRQSSKRASKRTSTKPRAVSKTVAVAAA